jgi:hypothetical protein
MVAIAAICLFFHSEFPNCRYIPAEQVKNPVHTADRVRQVLSTRGLSLYQVSKRSAQIFGRCSSYFIPQGFYHDLAAGHLNPNIYRFVALSQISNYRLCDWLAVFGFRLDSIPRIQLLTPSRRTVLLDSSIYDEEQWVPWFLKLRPDCPTAALSPLGRFLRMNTGARARDLLALNKRRFLYAKVGQDDAFAVPDLIPGSIVRINTRATFDSMSQPLPNDSKSIFLVENGIDLHCGQLRRIDKHRIFLYSPQFPFTRLELKLGGRVRIVGRVDAEIRNLSVDGSSATRSAASLQPTASAALTAGHHEGVHELLRLSRMRAGLSFREASGLSMRLSRVFGDHQYFAAPGTLSDYEKLASPFNHVQKAISLCALYYINFWVLLRAGGIAIDSLGAEAMDDHMVPRPGLRHGTPAAGQAGPIQHRRDGDGLLAKVINQWQELPLFIKDALPTISGLKDLSLADIFYVGANQEPNHPSLAGAEIVTVNRRFKKPALSTAGTIWGEPLYVLVCRDGSYLCGPCELRDGFLVVHPHCDLPQESLHFRRGVDAEVIGRITAILRRLP